MSHKQDKRTRQQFKTTEAHTQRGIYHRAKVGK